MGTGEQALTPGLAVPQWVGARSLLPGQHIRQKIDFLLQAGNGRLPCAGRERARDGHPGTRLRTQAPGRTQHPPEERPMAPHEQMRVVWCSSPLGCSPPAHQWSQIRDLGSARVLTAFGMIFTPQTSEAAGATVAAATPTPVPVGPAEPRRSPQAASTRCSRPARVPAPGATQWS